MNQAPAGPADVFGISDSFGGTDGAFHYNDTWSLDLKTRVWTELQCIGYIPVPREGHSAAMVDDVMYVFGGRDVNGKDLGDLAAFKITSECRRLYDLSPEHRLTFVSCLGSGAIRPSMVHIPKHGTGSFGT